MKFKTMIYSLLKLLILISLRMFSALNNSHEIKLIALHDKILEIQICCQINICNSILFEILYRRWQTISKFECHNSHILIWLYSSCGTKINWKINKYKSLYFLNFVKL